MTHIISVLSFVSSSKIILRLFLQLCGQFPDDLAGMFNDMKEFNDLLVEATTKRSMGGMLLDLFPSIRYLPWCPPYALLMKYMRAQDTLWEKYVRPALVSCDIWL